MSRHGTCSNASFQVVPSKDGGGFEPWIQPPKNTAGRRLRIPPTVGYHDRPSCESGYLKLVTKSLSWHQLTLTNSLASILSVASTKPQALPTMINPTRVPSQGPCHAAKNPPISAPAVL